MNQCFSWCKVHFHNVNTYSCKHVFFYISLFGVGASNLQYPRSPPHLSFALRIFLCPPTSIFHVLITTSSVFLSIYPNPNSFASLMFALMFVTLAIAIISSFLIFSILLIPTTHLNILISVLSSKFFSAFLSTHVSLPYIRNSCLHPLPNSLLVFHSADSLLLPSQNHYFYLEQLYGNAN